MSDLEIEILSQERFGVSVRRLIAWHLILSVFRRAALAIPVLSCQSGTPWRSRVARAESFRTRCAWFYFHIVGLADSICYRS